MVPGARVLVVPEKAEVVGTTKGAAEGAWVVLGPEMEHRKEPQLGSG